MLKAVLDTNIIVSALISPKNFPAEILKFWEKNGFLLIISPEIIEELQRVLSYRKIAKAYHLEKEKIKQLIIKFELLGFLVIPTEKYNIIKEDSADNKFLEAGVSGEAEYIISGDKHLLKLKEFKGIKIVSAKEFIKLLAG